jgi:hypothetical protein
VKLIYTNHAKKRMHQRAISEKEILGIIEFPEYTLKRGEEIEAYKKINNFMTKVVYVIKESYIKIITVYQLR